MVRVRKRLSPMTVTLTRHAPALTPVTLNPAAVSLMTQVVVLVVATTTRPCDVLPPRALIVSDLPTFTDFATAGIVGFSGGVVVAGEVMGVLVVVVTGVVVAGADDVGAGLLPESGRVVTDTVGFFDNSASFEVVPSSSSTSVHEVCPVSGWTAFAGHGVWRDSPLPGT